MHKSYAIQDGCHNCVWLVRHLDIVIPEKEAETLCGESPIREKSLRRGRTVDIVKFAEVLPAGKCNEWRGIV